MPSRALGATRNQPSGNVILLDAGLAAAGERIGCACTLYCPPHCPMDRDYFSARSQAWRLMFDVR